MQGAAIDAGNANDGAKTTFNPADTPNTAWTANGPQVPGTHLIMTITDTASAAQFGLQTASLSRAGDDSSSRAFIAPDQAGLSAGVTAMKASPVKGVVETDPSTTVAGAYPLTLLTYAVTTPETLTPAERQSYATFILFAIGDGQLPGVAPGDLPAGYLPLPGALRLDALDATNTILNPPAEPTAATTTSSTTSGSTATSTTGSSAVDSSASDALPDTTAATSSGVTSGTSAATTATTTPPTGGTRSIAAVKTSALFVGALRWALPIVLLVGLGAALGALLLGRTRRPTAGASGGPPTGGSAP